MDSELELSYLRTVELPQDQVDAIIRTKRKARDPKACYACHRRKVKCDRQLPCDSCVKRDHPELCSYERPLKRRHLAINPRLSDVDRGARLDSPESPPSPDTVLRTDRMGGSKDELEQMRRDLRALQAAIDKYEQQADHSMNDDKPVKSEDIRADDSEREGIHAPSGQIGTVHLGSRSVLAYVHGLGRTKESQEAALTLLGENENVLPKLGLDNESATFPFIDLWSTNASTYDVGSLCKLLPDDESCIEHVTPSLAAWK
jgi:hypothetical protein